MRYCFLIVFSLLLLPPTCSGRPLVELTISVAAVVTAAVTCVSRGEAEAGISRNTDAIVVDGLRTAYRIPPLLHSPVGYCPSAVEGGRTDIARRFLDSLLSRGGQEILTRYGFGAAEER